MSARYRRDLVAQMKNRALIYMEIYDVLRKQLGAPPRKVATLCRIAGAVDKGLFEGAGFAFRNRTWKPGAKGCCFLSIRRA